MKEDRDDYKDKVFSLANNPINNTALTNTHNGNNNILMLTPFDMNKQKFSDVIKESFTKDYMIEGQKGVAKFAVDKLLKDEDGKLQYVCTDPSRQIYKFKTIEGDVERDVKAQKLTKNIIEEIKRKSQSIVVADMNSDADVFMLITNNFQEINGMEGDNSDFRNTLASLTVC
jgi:TolB-like protein